MYLKRLELHGFKSFAPRTLLEYSPGITAIVGPNGSGKCLVGESLVTLADGRDVPIATLVDKALVRSFCVEQMDDGTLTRENPDNVHILSLDPYTLRLQVRPVTAFVKRTAPATLIRVRTRTGRSVTVTPYHPLFTLQHGQLHALRSDELREGIRIALPRILPISHRTVKLDTRQTLASFTEEDGVYVSPSSELRAWADTARAQHGTWKAWRSISQVNQVQLDGFLQRQGVSTSVLSRLASTAAVSLPHQVRYSSHASTSIVLPPTVTPDLARFLGLVIAEGRNTAEANIRFVNADMAVNNEFERLVRTLFDRDTFRRRYKENAEDLIIFSHALGHAMERLFGLAINSNSSEKCVPPQILESDPETQWAFLSGLFEGDGHVHLHSSKTNTKAQQYIEYVSASETLARGVVALLLRLGVCALLRPKVQRLPAGSKRETGTYYGVFIYGREQLAYTAQHLNFVGKKQEALLVLRAITGQGNPNYDLVPGATELVREATRRAKVNVKRHRAGRPKLAAYTEMRCEASRHGLLEVIQQINEVGETPECASAHLQHLHTLATSDVYWDEVVSIEEVAPSDPWVYDLCVAETHNFIAENMIVHNSNIADGIRWVLGEQSMRQLRGKKSDDVIFAGGQGRATSQMAEVGLVLDNSNSWLPSAFSEVTVTRRSFRSGDSEYLINGQRVRLKDVLLLLAQARIGHDSYTVVGQGMVDQALSLRAEERRGLFEDAAGIRQFQTQRNEAEQKLNLTQTNLARLYDIIGEIEPRLAPLAEQARRAEEFTGTRDELTRLLRIWYRRQWRELQSNRTQAELTEQSQALQIEKLHDALAVEDGLIEGHRQQREALLASSATLRRERSEAMNQVQTIERELAVANERLASLDQQEADLSEEQTQQQDAIDAANAHVGALEAQVERAEAQAERSNAALVTLESSLHSARQEQEREEARLRAAQREAIQSQARLGAAQTELGRLQRQLGERNRGLATRNEVVAQLRQKVETAEAQLEARRVIFQGARANVEALVAEREDLQRAISDGQSEIEQARAAVADAQRERRAAADRLALLQEWKSALEGVDDGARALLNANNAKYASDADHPPIIGMLSQLIGAPEGLEVAIETACGALLQAVVVRTRAEARAGAEWLRTNQAGHAHILWLDGAEPKNSEAVNAPAADQQATFGFARDLVTCQAELLPMLARVLGATYIVRDTAVVEQLWQGQALPFPIVTLVGDLFHPRGWLRGGSAAAPKGKGGKGDKGDQKETSVLARERELQQLPALLDRLDSSILERQAQAERTLFLQEERKQHADALRKELAQAEGQAQEQAKAVTTLQREQERVASELQVGITVAEQVQLEIEGIEQEVAATTAHVQEQEEAQRTAQEQVEDIQAEVDELLTGSRSQQEELARARTTAALHQQEVKTLGQRVEQLRAQAHELEVQMTRRSQRLEAITLQRTHLLELTTTQESDLATLRERSQELAEQLREYDTQQAHLDRQIQELERGQQSEREELARVEVEHRRSVIESQRARDAIEALAQQIREELGDEDEQDDPLETIIGRQRTEQSAVDEEPPDEASNEPLPTPEEATRMRRQIDQLRNRMKHLGGYDPDAPQVYQELKTRYDFLSAQIHDMTQAAQNLRAVIAELDTTMRRQFEETFEAVNLRFQQHFTTLFSGGAARLELTAPRRQQLDDEDEEQADGTSAIPKSPGFGGIEVFVQIPGKKVQDLSLLSGGERAMVSAALLFALLETNPPPFCLLDEVDAALDEANVMRFCDILKQLAQETQFIVITHNRVTMTHADAIYGVSMGGDSVSRVLSMRLAEVTSAR